MIMAEEQLNKKEISIDINKLRERKIFVATPMYGGQCSGMYTKSCTELAKLASHYKITCEFFFIFNESLITRARNYCVDEFLRHKDFTHLMFIDSDIGFSPNDVLALAALSDPDGDKDIICGPYPKKCISWEKIKQAVDAGKAEPDANALERYVGDYVLNPAPGETRIMINEPCEVLEGGTGFMMIQRKTLEKFAEAYPQQLYYPDHVRTKSFDGSRPITAFFDTIIDDDSKRYLSEDYMFCQWARRIGLKVWLCPWMQLAHVGTYTFGGSLADLATIGASATADHKVVTKK
jgi:hypothetical protein